MRHCRRPDVLGIYRPRNPGASSCDAGEGEGSRKEHGHKIEMGMVGHRANVRPCSVVMVVHVVRPSHDGSWSSMWCGLAMMGHGRPCGAA